ncbi:hypothetical protein NIES2100_38970 [Calothrix sp. NIES-2100]|nr:hypothetical protein NIES2100_38970 [Calothrix sp. NIES-2100]
MKLLVLGLMLIQAYLVSSISPILFTNHLLLYFSTWSICVITRTDF